MRTDNWYVLHVRTARELPVAEAARALEGVAAFVPMETLMLRHGDDYPEVRRLLYPGYVFVQTERLSAARYYEFKRIDGVIRLLGLADGDIPRSVPESEMAELLALMDNDCVIGVSRGVRRDNGKVEVTDGPLLGMKGRILKVDARQHRAVVRLSLMGQSQTVTLGLIVNSPTEPADEESPRAEEG